MYPCIGIICTAWAYSSRTTAKCFRPGPPQRSSNAFSEWSCASCDMVVLAPQNLCISAAFLRIKDFLRDEDKRKVREGASLPCARPWLCPANSPGLGVPHASGSGSGRDSKPCWCCHLLH